MREAYEMAIAPHENHGNTPVATNLSQSKSFVGIQMATQYKNYMDDALGKHRRYYLRAKYGLSKYDARWIARTTDDFPQGKSQMPDCKASPRHTRRQ